VSAFGAALPRTLEEFIVARFIGGLAIGAASVLAPLYFAEVAPARNRGQLVAMNQMAIVSGIGGSLLGTRIFSVCGVWIKLIQTLSGVF
jgi:SP family arabinose:H+ symporter-like MFS transporter